MQPFNGTVFIQALVLFIVQFVLWCIVIVTFNFYFKLNLGFSNVLLKIYTLISKHARTIYRYKHVVTKRLYRREEIPCTNIYRMYR